MNRTQQWMEDLQKNISDLIARSPAADVERNVRAMMTQTFARLDLITREEFEVQVDLLARSVRGSINCRRRCSSWKPAWPRSKPASRKHRQPCGRSAA